MIPFDYSLGLSRNSARPAAAPAEPKATPAPATPGAHPIPHYLSDQMYRVLAWLPHRVRVPGERPTDGEYAAVVYRHEPECADAPYAVWRVRRRPGAEALPADEPTAWKLDLGMFDLVTLREAMEEALITAGWKADR